MFKKAAFCSAAMLILATNAHAGCIGAVVNGSCAGAYVDSPSVGSNSNNNSGYQYDLNNPSDRNAYSIDLDAQRRDTMDLDMGRQLENGLGQYGGGKW